MGLFKESITEYVKTQLERRQELIQVHEDRSGRGGRGRVGVTNFPPGAWHAYTTNKYCNLRMSSCVDITTNELLELDLKVKGVQIEKHYMGSGLAKAYILQGGQLLNPRGAKTPAMRRGFPGGGRPLGGVYGDPMARADAADDYGIVPMPGITKMTVRTKSAYGSLKEAKVDFVCHNLRQLAVLEILYMRPGYPVLLEWGNSPYISNKGKIEKGLTFVSDIAEFWGSTYKGSHVTAMDQIQIAEEINKLKKEHDGNYDAILGLCKNFTYAVRPDGGFNCTTELMSVGEVISSMKGQTISYTYHDSITDRNNKTTRSVKKKILPALLDFLQRTHDFVYNAKTDWHTDDTRLSQTRGDDKLLQSDDDEHNDGKHANRSSAYMEPVERLGNTWGSWYKDRLNTYNIPRADLEKDYKERFFENSDFKEGCHLSHFKMGRTNFQDWVVGGAGAIGLAAGNIYIGALAASLTAAYQNNKLGFSEGFIRLDALCYIINKFCINTIPRGGEPYEKRFTHFQTINYDPYKSSNQYRMNKFSAYGDALSKNISKLGFENLDWYTIDCSTDPMVCMTPRQWPDKFKGLNTEWECFTKPLRNSYGYSGRDFKEVDGNTSAFDKCFGTSSNDIHEAQNSIGHIMMNINYLLDVHDDLYGEEGMENDNYSIGNFMAKVIKDINKSMSGNTELALVTSNENPSITEIVDLSHKPTGKWEDVFVFKVLSNDTIVRNFSYNSAVPSGMAATIAIGAGDPDNAASVDAVTFAAMNRGIKNRLYMDKSPTKPKSPTEKETTDAKLKLQDEYIEIRDIVIELVSFQVMIISGDVFQASSVAMRERLGNLKTTLSRLRDLVNKVLGKDKDGFVIKKDEEGNVVNPPASTPIPIKVDLTLDGIGGIVMGQLFRVEENRLPLQYRGQNIIFVCISEEQSVDSKGVWTTKIGGQMQLFPSKVEASEAEVDVTAVTSTFDPSPWARRFDNAMRGTGTKVAELDALFDQLTNEQLFLVENYWTTAPHHSCYKNFWGTWKNASLLQWIDNEIVGEGHNKYTRWKNRGMKKWSVENTTGPPCPPS